MHEDTIKKMKMVDRNNNAHSIQQMHAPRVKLPSCDNQGQNLMVLPLITLPVIMDKSLISGIYLMSSSVLFDSASTQTPLACFLTHQRWGVSSEQRKMSQET